MKFTAGIALLACASSTLAFAPQSFQRANTALNAGPDSLLSKKTGQSSLDPAVIAKYEYYKYFCIIYFSQRSSEYE